MAVTGIAGFQDFFKEFSDSYVVIGGSACSEWFSEDRIAFRETHDIDMVLIVEAKSAAFFSRIWEYARIAGYELLERADGNGKALYRFLHPRTPAYPQMIELLTGLPEVVVPEWVKIVHLKPGEEGSSLSAILLQSAYYELLLNHRSLSASGLPLVNRDALLLLKVKAYLNLAKEQEEGRFVKSSDLKKHRNDVFQLSYVLTGTFGSALPPPIQEDLGRFLALFAPDNPEWSAVQDSLRHVRLPVRDAIRIIDGIKAYFGL